MPSIKELDDTLARLQSDINRVQERRAAQLAAIADVATVRRTALAFHEKSCSETPCPLVTETAPTDAALWALPEHAFWERSARIAINDGAMPPVPEAAS